MADASKPVAKPAAAKTDDDSPNSPNSPNRQAAEAQEPDIDAGADAYVNFEPDPEKPDWENQRDQRDEAAMAAFGRPYAELSNVEQTTVHTGFDTGAAPQNPAGAAAAPVVEEAPA